VLVYFVIFVSTLDCSSLASVFDPPTWMSCSVSEECTRLHCCVFIEAINRSIDVELDIDTCNYMINVKIDDYHIRTSFFDFSWGEFKYLEQI